MKNKDENNRVRETPTDEPNCHKILKAKIDYYGETKAAYQFAAEEYERCYRAWRSKAGQEVNHAPSEWIACKDRMPHIERIYSDRVLIYGILDGDAGYDVHYGIIDKDGGAYSNGKEVFMYSHWMKISPPSQQDKTN